MNIFLSTILHFENQGINYILWRSQYSQPIPSKYDHEYVINHFLDSISFKSLFSAAAKSEHLIGFGPKFCFFLSNRITSIRSAAVISAFTYRSGQSFDFSVDATAFAEEKDRTISRYSRRSRRSLERCLSISDSSANDSRQREGKKKR